MKKAVLGLVLVFAAVVVFGQTIVVTPFNTRGQTLSRDDAASITELFIAELAKESGVRVVDRTSLGRVVREMHFQNTDWSNPQKTAQLGAALNAEFLVHGQLNQLGTQISFAITALDIKTLEVVSSSTRNFNVNAIFSDTRDGLFYQMSSMASGIAYPIKTKMTQLAEQRQKEQEEQQRQQQEQARLREQNRYSLVGTWVIGDFGSYLTSDRFRSIRYYNNSYKRGDIRQNRTKGTSYTRYLLSFSSNGMMAYFYETHDDYQFVQTYYTGTYIRRGDRLEHSLSGTREAVRGSNWSKWSEDYREYKTTEENVSSSDRDIHIEFRGDGEALIIRNALILNGSWGRNSNYPIH